MEINFKILDPRDKKPLKSTICLEEKSGSTVTLKLGKYLAKELLKGLSRIIEDD